ncbi:MAG TPA: SufD family Fe-S cluster assembly protein [Caulobacteraceae bacterium]
MSLARAIVTGDLAQLPSRRDEAWRWTDLRGLVRVLPALAPKRSAPDGPGPFDGCAEETVTIVNGAGPDHIDIAAGETRRIALRCVAVDVGSSAAQLNIGVGEGARLTLLETHEGAAAAVSEMAISIALAPGARVERFVLMDQAERAVAVVNAEIAAAPGAAFSQTIVTGGALRQRLETQVDNAGGATLRLDGLYLVGAARHADLTSVVVHAGRDGTTDQLAKGVVGERGRGVFQGLIRVARGADGAQARMGHHALVLSDHAEVDAKPELEIFADDVACAHGNTVGALDEEALFYAAQRGLPPAAARAMLTAAFVGEVVERIEDGPARAVVAAWVEARTEALCGTPA